MTRRLRWTGLIGMPVVLCLLPRGQARAEEGQLRRFENKMTPAGSQPLSNSPSCEERWSMDHPGQPLPSGFCENSVGDVFADSLLGPIVEGIVIAPFYLPAAALSDRYDIPPAFADYPYEGSHRGTTAASGKSWLVRAGAAREWGIHGTQAWRGDLSLTTSSRFGLDAAYTRYDENIGDESDSLAFFEFVPTFTFAHSDSWDWRAGLGYEGAEGKRHHDRLKTVYRVRYWLELPLRLDADFGASLASGKPIFEIAPGLAYMWKRYELKASYRRLSISNVTLQGPEVSLAIWF